MLCLGFSLSHSLENDVRQKDVTITELISFSPHSFRNHSHLLPFVQCLKVAILYILSSFRVAYGRRPAMTEFLHHG